MQHKKCDQQCCNTFVWDRWLLTVVIRSQCTQMSNRYAVNLQLTQYCTVTTFPFFEKEEISGFK